MRGWSRAILFGLCCGLVWACSSPPEATPEPTATGSETESSGSPTTGAVSTSVETTTASESGSATLETDSGTGAATSSTGGATTGAGFELEMHTLVADDGRLAIWANLPPQLEPCQATHPEAPCDDEDQDALSDAWEDAVLDRLHPIRRIDEQESLLQDDGAVVADVGRVATIDGQIHVYIMLGYSRDYGSCEFTAHNGDSERVALTLEPWDEGGPGGAIVTAAYTAAHEGSVNDQGRVVSGAEVANLVTTPDLETGDPRWVVFPSADKHATYSTIEICENVSFVPCIDEDCGADDVTDPEAYDLLPEVQNAGEVHARRLDDLTRIGFPGDFAWAEQDFCGGLGGSNCSSPVREKLLDNPF